MKTLWPAIVLFVLAVIVGVGLAVWTSLNSDDTRDPPGGPPPPTVAE